MLLSHSISFAERHKSKKRQYESRKAEVSLRVKTGQSSEMTSLFDGIRYVLFIYCGSLNDFEIRYAECLTLKALIDKKNSSLKKMNDEL